MRTTKQEIQLDRETMKLLGRLADALEGINTKLDQLGAFLVKTSKPASGGIQFTANEEHDLQEFFARREKNPVIPRVRAVGVSTTEDLKVLQPELPNILKVDE